MSFMSENKLKGRQLIAQQLISTGSFGLLLPYTTYKFIDDWLKLGPEALIISTLDEILNSFAKRKQPLHPGILAIIDKRMCQKISQYSKGRHGNPNTGIYNSYQ